MFKKAHIFFSLFFVTGAILMLAACTSPLGFYKEATATRLASPAWMVPRDISASPFILQAYERMHSRHAPANVYIEGDGKAWLSINQFSPNPTPNNPVALHLATKDASDNVVYLARPCQYKGMLDGSKCHPQYWTTKRYAPEVIESYNKALDDIKYRYNIDRFNLIGYSGGASVALLVAAKRSDVISVRTVAGNVDHKAHSLIHEVSELDGSLNPPDFATELKSVPQRHFIGGQDNIVPWGVIHSYLEQLGNTNCTQYTFVQEAEHEDGWVDAWPELLQQDVLCHGVPSKVVFRPIPYTPNPYVPPGGIPLKATSSSKP